MKGSDFKNPLSPGQVLSHSTSADPLLKSDKTHRPRTHHSSLQDQHSKGSNNQATKASRGQVGRSTDERFRHRRRNWEARARRNTGTSDSAVQVSRRRTRSGDCGRGALGHRCGI